jgi:hypothetical protein
MTHLLEEALAKLQQLPEAEQDAIASIILDELAAEQRWQAAFAASQGQLAKLAEKARADVRAGRAHEIGVGESAGSCR